MDQFNMFGGIDKIQETKKTPNKMKTMQQLFGERPDKICKSCKHCFRLDYHNNIYYKCELARISHGPATDIRLSHKACMKWE